MRQVNAKRLRDWLEAQGDGAKVDLHKKSKVSLGWIEKAVSGRYRFSVREITRAALCEATGLTEEELFPKVSSKVKRQAS